MRLSVTLLLGVMLPTMVVSDAEAGIRGRRRCYVAAPNCCKPVAPGGIGSNDSVLQAQVQQLQEAVTNLQKRVQQLERERSTLSE